MNGNSESVIAYGNDCQFSNGVWGALGTPAAGLGLPTACGGGGSSGGGGGGGGSQPVTSTITVTGISGSLQESTTFTLTVN